ncbi:MAG: RtcB family protein [Gammaproteobacteria bacterium]
MLRAVGMPDLHPGKGSPVGAVFACEGWIYPALVGNDIGCGVMGARSAHPQVTVRKVGQAPAEDGGTVGWE